VFGTAVSTTINSGVEFDFGVTSATKVNSGGFQFVDGLTSGAVVMAGGEENVDSGGTASGTTLSGGFMDVRSGGSIGAGGVTFASGGTLQLDDSVHLGGLVAGFGVPSLLDLHDIAFISGTTTVNFVEAPSNTSGTLTVGNGTSATTAHITLLGNYMAGNFHIQMEGGGGTLVMDPSVLAPTDTNPLTLLNTQH
jgi:autotransporter passenger strand-loop-strand repeat protein